jgi:ATP-dependent DNA helicase RecQ
LLSVEGDYGTLVLTDRSASVLRGESKVMMRREVTRPGAVAKASKPKGAAPVVDLPAEAMPLFEKLRVWRTGVAREQGMPPYVIFHDATLRAIAALNPSTLAELSTVNGVGENKLAKFGQQVLDTLAE